MTTKSAPAASVAQAWPYWLASAFALCLALALFPLRGHLGLDGLELRLADRFARSHAAQYPADAGIVLVDIDDAALHRMQGVAGLWPWPREVHADLLEAMAEFGPRAVVFDIAFAERDPFRPKSDARLGEAVGALPNVYLPATLLPAATRQPAEALAPLAPAFALTDKGDAQAQAKLVLPAAIPRAAWRLGLDNRLEDSDGVLRRYRLYQDEQGWRLPSLPARVAADLGAALPAGDSIWLRWPQQGHQRLAYHDLYLLLTEQRAGLAPAQLAEVDALLRGRIVIIGSSAASAFDAHVTPLSASHPGLDVMAVALDNMKNGSAIAVLGAGWSWLCGALLCAALAAGFARRDHPGLLAWLLALASAALLWLAYRLYGSGSLLPTVTPLLFAWLMYFSGALQGYLRERRARRAAVALFGRFLNPTVVQQIVEQGETVESLSGRTRELTVLFSDIRGFTTLSESRRPEEVVALLNRYFARQTEVVFRHGGTLDKFIGDCIMAFWGAPLDDAGHARHALAAALAMQDELLAFKAELAQEGWDVGDFDVGIGLHTGTAVVGFIGAPRKLDYTAIGDTVNLASRVEGLTRGVARVLVTRETMLACGALPGTEFIEHGDFAVKGRAAAVTLYEPKKSAPENTA